MAAVAMAGILAPKAGIMEESGAILSYGSDFVLGFGQTDRPAPSPWPDFKPRRAFSVRYEWIAYRDTMSESSPRSVAPPLFPPLTVASWAALEAAAEPALR